MMIMLIIYLKIYYKKLLKEKASDIHIEPFFDYLKIRIRVDGKMKEMSNLTWIYTNL